MVTNEGFLDLIHLARSFVSNLADAGDTVSKATGSARDPKNKYSMSSSARAASKLIAVFPVLCSSSVSQDTATLLNKYVERRACIQLQLALTAINITDAETGFEYLRNFHQNVLGSGSLRDYELMLDRMASEYAKNEEVHLTTEETKEFVKALQEMQATGYYEDNYNKLTLNDYIVEESADGYIVSVDRYRESHAVTEDGGSSWTYGKIKSDKPNVGEMRDADVKKANEAVPSLMIVRFTAKSADGASGTVTEFLIGVKSKLIPTDYDEILTKIKIKNRDGRGLVNLIRVTTGEINFITDYLLAMNQQKDAVMARSKRGSNEALWKRLENDAMRAEIALRGKKTNYASAVTTCVISSEDADYLFKHDNIDIRNVKEALKFMQSYNLMGLIIANDADEVAWMIFDEDDAMFEKVSYTMLERETGDGQYKKIVNLLSKMR